MIDDILRGFTFYKCAIQLSCLYTLNEFLNWKLFFIAHSKPLLAISIAIVIKNHTEVWYLVWLYGFSSLSDDIWPIILKPMLGTISFSFYLIWKLLRLACCFLIWYKFGLMISKSFSVPNISTENLKPGGNKPNCLVPLGLL